MKRFKTRLFSLGLPAIAVAITLVACGGGGGGGSAPETPAVPVVAPPKADGITYTAFTEDRVSSGPVTFDIDSQLTIDSFTYTLASTANGGCTFTSSPFDSTAPAGCGQLAGGEGFLLCNDTAGESFNTVFFKSTVVHADFNDLLGHTVTGTSCGSSLLRSTPATIEFRLDGSFVELLAGTITGTFTGFLPGLTSPQGVRDFGYTHRFEVRKVAQGAKTVYFLLDLFENDPGSTQAPPPRIYTIEL
jgi:hypothetical protein